MSNTNSSAAQGYRDVSLSHWRRFITGSLGGTGVMRSGAFVMLARARLESFAPVQLVSPEQTYKDPANLQTGLLAARQPVNRWGLFVKARYRNPLSTFYQQSELDRLLLLPESRLSVTSLPFSAAMWHQALNLSRRNVTVERCIKEQVNLSLVSPACQWRDALLGTVDRSTSDSLMLYLLRNDPLIREMICWI